MTETLKVLVADDEPLASERLQILIERLDQVDEAVEAKLAALERTSNPKP